MDVNKIRNIAIIAHVDHGKTTLVDKLLMAGKLFKDHETPGELIMDSNDLEKERGITILAKNVSVRYKDYKINVIVENHGGYSSDGNWLSKVIADTQMDNCGTLPDFGNFCITRENDACVDWYDRYKGTEEMMSYAKGVSAKANDFDAAGNCVETDYNKMLRIVKDAGYKGYIGIEYEGNTLSEDEGIRATKVLLERAGAALS